MKKYLQAEEIELVHSGKDFFKVLNNVIDCSVKTLHLQTYIFASDETGTEVIASLIRAAKRGVSVYLLIDAYGSFPFSKEFQHQLREAGVRFRMFSKLFSSENISLWRRLHHKIVVADKKLALVGGINVANKYNKWLDEEPWLDYAVLIKGNVCEYLDILCDAMYYKRRRSLLRKWELKPSIPELPLSSPLIRFRQNDFLRNKQEIHLGYSHAIARAESKIILVASYFLPGRHLRKMLYKAAERGVKIQIILAGKSDVGSARLAQNYLFDFYRRSNIEIIEWQNSILHGKAMLVDDTWATVGSYNLNFLSRYISIELNVDVIDRSFAHDFSLHLNKIISENKSKNYKKDDLEERSSWKRLKMWLAYNFYRLLMLILVARRKHKRKHN
ncbi:MAG: hypothetical protein JNL60_03500 [Bacteroidia bacterium]|nr:hypothetical protein [Bacteroidia bacterium]